MKKNILKAFAVLLALVMLFALASCGKDNNDSKTADTSSVIEAKQEETIGTTDNTDKENTKGKIVTEKDNQVPPTAGSVGIGDSGKDGSAKPGGKDAGKDPGKTSGKTDSGKSTGSNTSETSKPSVGNGNTSSDDSREETTSNSEPEDKDNEGEFVIPHEGIQLPVVPIG